MKIPKFSKIKLFALLFYFFVGEKNIDLRRKHEGFIFNYSLNYGHTSVVEKNSLDSSFRRQTRKSGKAFLIEYRFRQVLKPTFSIRKIAYNNFPIK